MQDLDRIIDHFSINDDFWVQLKSHLISFGFKGLPAKVHYTISFDDRSPDINFHVTKNVDDQTNKPKVRVVCIDKVLLEEIIPSVTLTMLNKLLQPIDIEEIKNKYDYELGFISFKSMENSDHYSLTEQKLIDTFKDMAKYPRKTRLKIEGDIEKRLVTFATSEDLQESFYDNMVDLSSEFEKAVEGGVIISEDNTLHVMRINNKWFTFRKGTEPIDVLTLFVNPILAKKLIEKTMSAIEVVSNANTYQDTEYFDKPIRLVKIQTKETNSPSQL